MPHFADSFTVRATFIGTALMLGACTGTVTSNDATQGTGGNASEPGGGGSGGSRGDGSLIATASGDPEINKLTCDRPGTAASAIPLRRLTRIQYTNTLNDLLGKVTPLPADLQLPDEALIAGFDNNSATQTSTLALMQGYRNVAMKMAKDATGSAAKLAQLSPCTSGQTDETCATAFIKDFGRKSFRRPLLPEEATRLLAVFKAVQPSLGYAQGIEATLAAMLLAPQFTFRAEYGTGPVTDGALKLDSYEMASRLSYLLWDTMPDAALMAAADAKDLDSPEGLEKQLNRMLADERAHASVQRFHAQWLGLSKFDKLAKDPVAFPKFDAATKASMRASMEKFIDYAFWTKGTLSALLTDSNAFVDDKLAALYGVSGTQDLKLTPLDGTQRSGLLTQAGLMAVLAKSSFDDPIHRGTFVINNLLCGTIPPAPMGVPPLEAPKAGESPKTTRQRIEQSHSQPQCAACHKTINGVGFGFEHYDAVGTYRTQENGAPIDAHGELVGTRDVDGTFDGAIELAGKLSQSSQVQQCMATQWFRYAFGKTESTNDSCALKPIVDVFVSSHGDIKQLLNALIKSDAFRYRNAI